MKLYPALYAATATPRLLTVPALPILAVDGTGAPDGPGYRAAVEALYGTSYAIRSALGRGYSVASLEGLWWGDRGPDFTDDPRDAWHWTMLIPQPAGATAEVVADALAATRRKRPSPAVERLELRVFDEGVCAQVLHIGPYAAERPTVHRLLEFVAGQQHRVTGHHHEIYLSNPARTAPEKLKTIIRYAVAPT